MTVKRIIAGVISYLMMLSLGILPAFAASPSQEPATGAANYTLEQAMSDNAQLSTIAFSGLAFITGSAGADTFIPPGKVADFFGFQYMRDVDTAGYGHNTQFLSRVANNVLYILSDSQKAKLLALAKEQAPLYTNFAYNRFPIMNAFRQSLEGRSGLSLEAVSQYTAKLYQTDAALSYQRAVVVGEIIRSFTEEQKSYLSKMAFDNFNTWPDVPEDAALKQSVSNTEFVAVMTYASELFSWYKGSITADVYFCPERHGTYFGGFFMKDYPAMNNPDYFISTAITGDKGKLFLELLNPTQRALVEGIIPEQKDALKEIAAIRAEVSAELRKAQTGAAVDQETVYRLIERYGYLDGQISALYATRFSQVNATLTEEQRAALVNLRDLSVQVTGAYAFSTPIAMPTIPNNDFMFGVGSMPADAGQYPTPEDFMAGREDTNPAQNKPPKQEGTTKPNDQGKTNQNSAQPKKGEIQIILSGKSVALDGTPSIENGRLLVPVRIAQQLGAKVSWDNESKTVSIVKGDTTVLLPIGKPYALVNGESKNLDVPAKLKNNRTYIPIRFIGEVFGMSVSWDNTTRTVTLTKG